MSDDVSDLLETASAGVPNIDFAQRAWDGAQRRRVRARRLTALGAAAAVLVAVLVGTQLTHQGSSPLPAHHAPSITESATPTLWRTAPDGTRYAIAPAPGTEASLPRSGFPGLDTIDPTSAPRNLLELVKADPRWKADTPVAVFLKAVDAPTAEKATLFQPIFARVDGSLVSTELRLGLLHDAAGNPSMPLSAGSLSFRRVAFPQPGKVVVLDLTTGKVTTHPVPSTTIQQVRWAPAGSEKVVASGPDGAWLIDTSSTPSPQADPERLPAGYTGANYTVAATPGGGLALTSWELEGLRHTAQPVTAPATDVVGQTVSSDLLAASGVRLDDTVDPLEGANAHQGILSVTTYDPNARQLLVLRTGPTQSDNCCRVVGLFPQNHPIYTSTTGEGLWLLQWNPESGAVSRVLLLEADPTVPPAISLGINSAS